MKNALDFLTATSRACKDVISSEDPEADPPDLPTLAEVAQDIISQTIAAICITTFSQLWSLRTQLVTKSDFVARSTTQRLNRSMCCVLGESAPDPESEFSFANEARSRNLLSDSVARFVSDTVVARVAGAIENMPAVVVWLCSCRSPTRSPRARRILLW